MDKLIESFEKHKYKWLTGGVAFVLIVVILLIYGKTEEAKVISSFFIGAIGVFGLAVNWWTQNKRVEQGDKQIEDNRKKMEEDKSLRESELAQDRFAQAIEQIGSEKSAVRLGAIYSLHQLAKTQGEQYAEPVFNILISYIRDENKSLVGEKNIDKEKLQKPSTESEAIISLLFKRADEYKSYEERLPKDYEINLSNTAFLISDWSKCVFYRAVNFYKSEFKSYANFLGSTFKGGANFLGSTFKGRANFLGSTFEGGASFSNSTFKGGTYFFGSIFKSISFTLPIQDYEPLYKILDHSKKAEVYLSILYREGLTDIDRSKIHQEMLEISKRYPDIKNNFDDTSNPMLGNIYIFYKEELSPPST